MCFPRYTFGGLRISGVENPTIAAGSRVGNSKLAEILLDFDVRSSYMLLASNLRLVGKADRFTAQTQQQVWSVAANDLSSTPTFRTLTLPFFTRGEVGSTCSAGTIYMY